MPSEPGTRVAAVNMTPEELLRVLQRGVDTVRAGDAPSLRPEHRLSDDLDLDSLDTVDVLTIAESELPPGVIDTVIDRLPDLRTVGEIVDAVLAAGATAHS